MNRLNLFLTIIFLFTVSSNLFGQLFSRERAQKHFDRGMMIIEYAETTDDYKKAIKQFDNLEMC